MAVCVRMSHETLFTNSGDNNSRHQTDKFLQMICSSVFEYSDPIVGKISKLYNSTVTNSFCFKSDTAI